MEAAIYKQTMKDDYNMQSSNATCQKTRKNKKNKLGIITDKTTKNHKNNIICGRVNILK
jgi:hypothetical protein